jgi:hypothetical protein
LPGNYGCRAWLRCGPPRRVCGSSRRRSPEVIRACEVAGAAADCAEQRPLRIDAQPPRRRDRRRDIRLSCGGTALHGACRPSRAAAPIATGSMCRHPRPPCRAPRRCGRRNRPSARSGRGSRRPAGVDVSMCLERRELGVNGPRPPIPPKTRLGRFSCHPFARSSIFGFNSCAGKYGTRPGAIQKAPAVTGFDAVWLQPGVWARPRALPSIVSTQ